VPPDLKEVEDRLFTLRTEKEAAVRNQEFEKAAKLRDQEHKLKEELEEQKKDWEQKMGTSDLSLVGEEDVAYIVSSWTGIPLKRLAQEESDRLLKLEETLHKRIVGQDEAVRSVSRAVRRARAGLKDPKRPIGSFIFLGPTGVGKTELGRALAEALFGDENAIIRLDMSEYMEKHTAARLIGAPPGYIGYEEGGQLTEKVRRKPYSVLLLDEMEKAHPDVFNILLQILEDGRLTDGKGRTVDFRNTVVIMTSNVGANFLNKSVVGFGSSGEEADYEMMKERVMDELKRTFRPEFLNRVDDLIVFHALSEEHIRQIVEIMLEDLNRRIEEYSLHMEVSDKVKGMLLKEGFDPNFGARPLRRAIQRRLEDGISEELLQGKIAPGDTVAVDLGDEEGLVFSKK